MDRREFLRFCGLAIPGAAWIGSTVSCRRGPSLPAAEELRGWDGVLDRLDGDLLHPPERPATLPFHPAEHFTKMPDGRLRCDICPHRCVMAEGERGRCKMRLVREGTLGTDTYGLLISRQLVSPDTFPLMGLISTPWVRAGVFGCSFDCDFCSSLPETPRFPETAQIRLVEQSPQALADYMQSKGARHVNFGYFEPTVNFEFVRDFGRIARERGISIHLDTNGFVEPEPFEELLEVTDEIEVGLKGFDPAFYQDVCKGTLPPVLERIRQVVARGRLLTVGLLFVPGIGDGPDQVRGVLQWVRENAGVDTALWIRGMVPSRRMMRLSVTTPEFLAGVEDEARKLGFRYISVVDAKRGVIGPDEVPCPGCGHWVIRRLPDRRLERNVRDGRCASCGTAIRLWS